jgi:exodeoxyribonuclease VIII
MNLKTGVYADISANDYHSKIEAVSNSYLSKLDKCPAAAKVVQEDSAAFAFGRAAHTLCLEGEGVFYNEFAVSPAFDKRTKEGKERFAEFQAAAAGKDVITEADFELILDIRDALNQHPFAKTILKEGISEQTVIWNDSTTGIRCKCRPDRIPSNGRGVIVDLKTTSDAGEYAFSRSVVNYGYARQAALYLDGYNAAAGADVDAFVFVTVEKTAPYRVATYLLDDDFIRWGRDEYRRLLQVEQQCREEKYYPNYLSADLLTLYKPNYL